MPEVAEQKQPEAVASVEANPFDDNSWKSQPPQETLPKEPVSIVEKQPEVPKEDEFEEYDANEYLKQQLGYDNWDIAKTELQKLRELQEKGQPQAEIKFANEDSQKFFDALKEGKIDDVYSYLHKQRELDRLGKLELSTTQDAADVIKAAMRYKNPDLTQKEIDFLYNKKYSIPQQPRQFPDQTDEEYKEAVDEWKLAVQEREQEIIIQAKLDRPDILRFKSELVLPEIPKTIPQAPQIDPKVLEQQEANRNMYLRTLESEYSKFNGFETKVKDESVELPVSFNVPDDEKIVYANKLKDFDINEFFGARWFDSNNRPNVNQMMADLYLLENPEKVFQGLSNNAAAKRLENHLKVKSNVKVDGPQSLNVNAPDVKDIQTKQEEALWNA